MPRPSMTEWKQSAKNNKSDFTSAIAPPPSDRTWQRPIFLRSCPWPCPCIGATDACSRGSVRASAPCASKPSSSARIASTSSAPFFGAALAVEAVLQGASVCLWIRHRAAWLVQPGPESRCFWEEVLPHAGQEDDRGAARATGPWPWPWPWLWTRLATWPWPSPPPWSLPQLPPASAPPWPPWPPWPCSSWAQPWPTAAGSPPWDVQEAAGSSQLAPGARSPKCGSTAKLARYVTQAVST
mmetsp:Transcript_243/g.1022  ORF Transcript_243/g.1022 Transcript_243/m.1022 type:complete len:240 (-) Transcript_243:439-1158(-)